MALSIQVSLFSCVSMCLNKIRHFFMVKGPAADATDALQPWGLLCNNVMKISFFLIFPCKGMKLTGENRSTWGQNLSQCHFVHHEAHMDWPGIEPVPPQWEAGD